MGGYLPLSSTDGLSLTIRRLLTLSAVGVWCGLTWTLPWFRPMLLERTQVI